MTMIMMVPEMPKNILQLQ